MITADTFSDHAGFRRVRKGVGFRMGCSTREKMRKVTESLRALDDGFSQFEYLLTKGMEHGSFPEIQKDSFRIGGCRTAIWICVQALDRTGIRFSADSDSLLVKGVLSLMEEIYTGATPEEAVACPTDFLDVISDEIIYPDIKKNGLRKCWNAISAREKCS